MALDDLSREYIELACGIERHNPGTIDAYFGPPDVRAAAEAGPVPAPADLLARATTLLGAIDTADLPPSRADYLTAQLRALRAQCRKLTGEAIPYREEVELLLDVTPERIPDATYDEAIRALDDALPGDGPVAERMIAWRARFEVPAEVARSMIDAIVAEVRTRTAAFVALPAGEAIEIGMVRDKPWSGYNWYLGDARSLIEINTDLPIRASRLLDLICHEGYPGHHTEHAVKEIGLYRGAGFGEHAIQLINTPECVISEGIATLAQSILFTPEEEAAWRGSHLYGPAGITVDTAQEIQINAAQTAMRSVGGNAALLMHDEEAPDADVIAYLMRYGLETEERARHRLRFFSDPLWRPYIFTYHVGYGLLDRWLDRDEEDGTREMPAQARRQQRFAALLREQVTPSAIGAAIA